MAALRKNMMVRLNGDNEHTDTLKIAAVSTDGEWARVVLPNGMTTWRHGTTVTVVQPKRKSRAKVTAVETVETTDESA